MAASILSIRPKWFRSEFGGNPYLTADPGPGLEPASQQSFGVPALAGLAGPEAVAVGGVDPAPALLDEPVEQGERAVLIDRGAEEHRAEDQRCGGHCFRGGDQPGRVDVVCGSDGVVVGHVIHPATWSALKVKSYALHVPTYTPAQASREFGFSLDTLRYYEREGILPDVARTSGGRRVYTDADLGTLGFLRCLRDTGMPITLLRRYGQLCQDESTLPQRIELLEEHARNVADQLAALHAQQTRLCSKLDLYRGELSRRQASAS